jgi:signal transduction histidine kinase
MTALPLNDVLEAAAYALISERWQRAYMHDMRSGLQTLRNALELLARAARGPSENLTALEKSVSLAKRAMDNHEQFLAALMRQTTRHEEAAAAMNLGELVGEVLGFARIGASAKSIVFRVESIPDAPIVAQSCKCRLLLLGICTVSIDELGAGSVIDVGVRRSGSDAVVEFKSGLPCPAIRNPADLWHAAQGALIPYELILALTRQWAGAHGGRLECGQEPDLRSALRIYYPMAAQ